MILYPAIDLDDQYNAYYREVTLEPAINNGIEGQCQIVAGGHMWVRLLDEEGGPTGNFQHFHLDDLVPEDSGWSGLVAIDINDHGMITGVGSYQEVDAYGNPVDGPVNRAFLLIEAAIAVDANRDQKIYFSGEEATDNKGDATTAQSPYRFWLNNDRDVGVGNEGEDLEAVMGQLDNEDDKIANKRDLEDFTRIILKTRGLAEQLRTGALQLGLRWSSQEMNPAVRIFRATTEDSLAAKGGFGYLFDDEWADMQIWTQPNDALGLASSMEETFFFDSDYVTDNAEGDTYRDAFIFEGVGAGKGELQLVVKYENWEAPIAGGVHMDLRDIKKFYQIWSVGEGIDEDPTSVALEINNVDHEDLNELGLTQDYVLFVHGWRLRAWERKAFAETAFKRLYWQNFNGRFGMFSWPTRWVNTDDTLQVAMDPLNYDNSEFVARQAGQNGLRNLLADRSASYRVHILAHSMGNVVASEALVNSTGVVVESYIATQAASVGHSYNRLLPTRPLATKIGSNDIPNFLIVRSTPNVYGNFDDSGHSYYYGLESHVSNFENFYNVGDFALENNIWGANQDLKPDLGWNYDPQGGWYRIDAPDKVVSLAIPVNRNEIFSYIAEAQSDPLGKISQVSSFPTNLASEFKFGRTRSDHSGQFMDTIIVRHQYWLQIIESFGIPR
jgi:hypothetical protein